MRKGTMAGVLVMALLGLSTLLSGASATTPQYTDQLDDGWFLIYETTPLNGTQYRLKIVFDNYNGTFYDADLTILDTANQEISDEDLLENLLGLGNFSSLAPAEGLADFMDHNSSVYPDQLYGSGLLLSDITMDAGALFFFPLDEVKETRNKYWKGRDCLSIDLAGAAALGELFLGLPNLSAYFNVNDIASALWDAEWGICYEVSLDFGEIIDSAAVWLEDMFGSTWKQNVSEEVIEPTVQNLVDMLNYSLGIEIYPNVTEWDDLTPFFENRFGDDLTLGIELIDSGGPGDTTGIPVSGEVGASSSWLEDYWWVIVVIAAVVGAPVTFLLWRGKHCEKNPQSRFCPSKGNGKGKKTNGK